MSCRRTSCHVKSLLSPPVCVCCPAARAASHTRLHLYSTVRQPLCSTGNARTSTPQLCQPGFHVNVKVFGYYMQGILRLPLQCASIAGRIWNCLKGHKWWINQYMLNTTAWILTCKQLWMLFCANIQYSHTLLSIKWGFVSVIKGTGRIY